MTDRTASPYEYDCSTSLSPCEDRQVRHTGHDDHDNHYCDGPGRVHDHGHHGHDHHHHSPDDLAQMHQWRIGIAILCGAIAIVVQVAIGLWAGSLALLSDSAHVFTDLFGLIGAYAAIAVGRKAAATDHHTFGFRRLEVLAAGLNALLLIVVAIVIVKEAIERLMHPAEVMGLPVAIVATVGLLLNIIAFLVMRSGKDDSINVRAAYLEVMADMVGSVGVLLSGVIVYLTGWRYADIIVAVLIALWVLPRTTLLLKQVVSIILQGTPNDVDMTKLRSDMMAVPGVRELHHFHVWSMTTGSNVGSVHVVTDNPSAGQAIRHLMESHYGLEHVTVQTEDPEHSCPTSGNC